MFFYTVDACKCPVRREPARKATNASPVTRIMTYPPTTYQKTASDQTTTAGIPSKPTTEYDMFGPPA